MNLQKAFPFAIAALVLVILAIIFSVLTQDGTIKLRPSTATTTLPNSAVVKLVVTDGKVTSEPVQDFLAFVQSADRPVFADFWAAWCGPCRDAAPFVEQLALDYDGRAFILKVDVDQATALARSFNAQSIPLFVVFAGGQEVDRALGYAASLQGSLRQMIDNQLP
jgi:thioredoxin 1